MRSMMLALGMTAACGPATPVAVSAADKQLKVEVTSVQLPSHSLLPAEDQVTVHVWLTIKDCPPVGKLVATANGVEMSEWGRGGLMVQSPFALSPAVSPQCIPWEFATTVPRAWLGPGPALKIEVKCEMPVAVATIEDSFRVALPEGKGVNEAFVMRFDPGPAPELDLINCDDRQTAGLTFSCVREAANALDCGWDF